MITHDLVQGSPEWHAHRNQHFNASDAPAMMGCSPYKTRSQLLAELATGMSGEVDAGTQALFDRGHRFEALARPVAEEIIGQELYPVVGSDGRYSASFDGLTMDEDVAFEHKTLNRELRAVERAEDLPLQYRVQMEQQAMVSGCTRGFFLATEWASDDTLTDSRHFWYRPDPALRAKIVAGWEQFAADLATYKAPPAAPPAPVAASIQALPALTVNVEGRVTASNLDAFKSSAESFLANISTDLTTDQHFADAEKTVKFCKEGEERLELVKAQALAQTATIDELFRAIDHIKEQLRAKRLALDKLVTTRKADMRAEIVAKAQAALDAYVAGLNARLGAQWLPRTIGPFADAIKGMKSLDNIQNAADTALANAKIAAGARADQLDRNRKALAVDGTDWVFLFADFAQAGNAAAEVFDAIAAQRIKAHVDAEAAAVARKAEALAAAQAESARRAAAAVPAPAPVQPPAAPAEVTVAKVAQGDLLGGPAAPDTRPPISTGEIGKRLGFVLQVAFIEETLGVKHATQDKRAMLWRESDWPEIKAALVRHVGGLG